METSSFHRREMLKKLIGASVGTTVCQIFGVGQSPTAISALAQSSDIADLYYLNLDPYYQIKLPKITAELNQVGLERESLKPYISELQNIQKIEQQVYEKELKTVADEVKESIISAEKWRLASTISAYSFKSSVKSVAISSDGQTIASGGYDTIYLWDLETGEQEVNCLAFSPDGHTLVSGSSDKTIKIWQDH